MAIREGAIAAITGAAAGGGDPDPVRDLIERAAVRPEILGPAETRLFLEWARRFDGA
ncbi:hypothetical protein [Aeromicrobium sp. PE09-221]|uniref:hypothetical protein n=1 Tax=Aeromicrobium sp. PE09-221 TaxID=1898043 RepID=UPI001482343B|nr:hypothetical protein [Aeromicrobium sp. PE09-221]